MISPAAEKPVGPLPAGWWDGIPKAFKDLFERKTLRRGYVLHVEGQVILTGFFRNVYQALVKDVSEYRCLYIHEGASGSRAVRARLHCSCRTKADWEPCAHLAALLFRTFAGKSGSPCGEAYAGSVWAQLALGLCRTYSTLHDIHVRHLPQGAILADGTGKAILAVDATDRAEGDGRSRWPGVSLLPPGWEASEEGGLFATWCRMEILPAEAQTLKMMGHAPSLRAEFSPVGECCRQAFLAAPQARLERLDWDAGKELFHVLISDPAASLTATGYLQSDQAFSLNKKFPEARLGDGFSPGPETWRKCLEIRVDEAGKVRIRPFAESPSGERVFPESGNGDIRFGNMPLLPGIGFRTLTVPEGALFRKYIGWKPYTLAATAVMDFLIRFGEELSSGSAYDVDALLKSGTRPAVLDEMVLRVEDRDGRRFRIALEYVLGGRRIDLSLLKSVWDAGQSCLITTAGWINLSSQEWTWIKRIAPDAWAGEGGSLSVWATMPFLIRLCVLHNPRRITLEGKSFPELQTLPSLATGAGPLPDLDEPLPVEGLRPYQVEGVRWLAHLVSCGVSGILADDMGLGKTHQVMALAAWLNKRSGGSAKILVVCPTSVLYHWKEKLDAFHPELDAALYYGPGRLPETLDKKVCITSYGIARRDMEILRRSEYALLVLDEIQNAKNRDSETHRCFQDFPARSLIGLSGTPLENGPLEVKNLFDLLLPGYFPGESQFRQEILEPLENRQGEAEARERFLSLCRPFILRRNKADVLQDLPDKVEETYHCDLAPDQAELYRECLVKKGGPLLQSLRESGPTNLLHIFQLLTHLKQICNHPMTLSGSDRDGREYGSGKWDLFAEILEQSLEAGNKVVVFSQYLGMLSWVEAHLEKSGIGFASLTGSTRDRQGVLKRFREEASCRVFCCSLKAGGVGIDLTAASTVIHYDRWWNAARENQATDRVHRIGQERNVQVFKLVTRDTIEERIDAIIRKKAAWMESLLPEDGEDGLKLFTREDLMDLLRVRA